MAKTNCFNLMNGSNEAFYWVGFILADGCVSEDRPKNKKSLSQVMRLSITLNIIDLEHLIKYRNFINSGVVRIYNDKAAINTYDGTKELMTNFNINLRKTYNPSDFSYYENYSREQLLSLFCGLLDGDGSVTYKHGKKSVFLRVGAHNVWETFYRKLLAKLEIPFTFIPHSKFDYFSLSIQNKPFIAKLYEEIKTLNIPILGRKWDKITTIPMDLTAKKKIHQFDLNGSFIKEYESVKQAGEELGIDNTGISKCLKGHLKKSGGYIWKYA